MTEPVNFRSIDAIRKAVTASGSHYFEPDTMRFFRSRLSSTVYGGRFFVTSEQDPSGYRAYSVREVHRLTDGTLSVRSAPGTEFMQFPTRHAAIARAREIARRDVGA